MSIYLDFWGFKYFEFDFVYAKIDFNVKKPLDPPRLSFFGKKAPNLTGPRCNPPRLLPPKASLPPFEPCPLPPRGRAPGHKRLRQGLSDTLPSFPKVARPLHDACFSGPGFRACNRSRVQGLHQESATGPGLACNIRSWVQGLRFRLVPPSRKLPVPLHVRAPLRFVGCAHPVALQAAGRWAARLVGRPYLGSEIGGGA